MTWHRGDQKWQAAIKVEGRSKHLGHFDDEAEAARTYDAVASGLGRKLNFPMPARKVGSSKAGSGMPPREVSGLKTNLRVQGSPAGRARLGGKNAVRGARHSSAGRRSAEDSEGKEDSEQDEDDSSDGSSKGSKNEIGSGGNKEVYGNGGSGSGSSGESEEYSDSDGERGRRYTQRKRAKASAPRPNAFSALCQVAATATTKGAAAVVGAKGGAGRRNDGGGDGDGGWWGHGGPGIGDGDGGGRGCHGDGGWWCPSPQGVECDLTFGPDPRVPWDPQAWAGRVERAPPQQLLSFIRGAGPGAPLVRVTFRCATRYRVPAATPCDGVGCGVEGGGKHGFGAGCCRGEGSEGSGRSVGRGGARGGGAWEELLRLAARRGTSAESSRGSSLQESWDEDEDKGDSAVDNEDLVGPEAREDAGAEAGTGALVSPVAAEGVAVPDVLLGAAGLRAMRANAANSSGSKAANDTVGGGPPATISDDFEDGVAFGGGYFRGRGGLRCGGSGYAGSGGHGGDHGGGCGNGNIGGGSALEGLTNLASEGGTRSRGRYFRLGAIVESIRTAAASALAPQALAPRTVRGRGEARGLHGLTFSVDPARLRVAWLVFGLQCTSACADALTAILSRSLNTNLHQQTAEPGRVSWLSPRGPVAAAAGAATWL